jgi:hypothetical protein
VRSWRSWAWTQQAKALGVQPDEEVSSLSPKEEGIHLYFMSELGYDLLLTPSSV